MVPIYTRRRILNAFNLSVAMLTTGFALFCLAWLLWTLIASGLSHINWNLFTQPTPPPGESGGGLKNPIIGSLMLTGVGVGLGSPLGVLAGTYLAEYGRSSRLASVVRFVNDILLSAPSILIGVFVYGLIVVSVGHFSGWAGGIALTLIMIPVVVRTTEDMLALVPDQMREAAAALGAPYWRVVLTIVYRAASKGIMTGILLGLARISGETAPLLFTALNNQFMSWDMGHAIANLPVVIFQFAMSPYNDWQHLAWAGSLLITFTILILSIVARFGLQEGKG